MGVGAGSRLHERLDRRVDRPTLRIGIGQGKDDANLRRQPSECLQERVELIQGRNRIEGRGMEDGEEIARCKCMTESGL
jgi:hypothetical protein